VGWRPEDGGGGGSRQEWASASGGTVQSDQRRGASETGTVPTARVRHKKLFENDSDSEGRVARSGLKGLAAPVLSICPLLIKSP
jgi:hypothetical protein